MPQRRYKIALDRHETLLLPPSVEQYVGKDNPVRAIDLYINRLDLQEMGFTNTSTDSVLGQPAYNPAALLKLYLYGYIQRIRSSRMLERETRRNLEVIWLTEGLQPAYKTIANFRKDNGAVIKTVNRDFILICKELSLLGCKKVAVDGSFMNADINKSHIYTEARLTKELERLDKKINEYHQILEEQDSSDDKAGKGNLVEDEQLTEKLEKLEKKQAQNKALQEQLKKSGNKQIALVDKDARLGTWKKLKYPSSPSFYPSSTL